MNSIFSVQQTNPIAANAGLQQTQNITVSGSGYPASNILGNSGNVQGQNGSGWASLVASSSSPAAASPGNLAFYFLIAALAYFGFRKVA